MRLSPDPGLGASLLNAPECEASDFFLLFLWWLERERKRDGILMRKIIVTLRKEMIRKVEKCREEIEREGVTFLRKGIQKMKGRRECINRKITRRKN